jgi:hypothetical protein
MAQPHPTVCALYGPLGSSCAMSWWCRCPTHRERGQSLWRVGRQHLILLLCVVGGGCGWEENCSVSSTWVKRQKQSDT